MAWIKGMEGILDSGLRRNDGLGAEYGLEGGIRVGGSEYGLGGGITKIRPANWELYCKAGGGICQLRRHSP